MKTLLQLKTSLFSDQGQSNQLANDFVRAWQARHPSARVVVRDLAREPVPHLNAERLQAFATPAEQLTTAQREIVAYSDALIAELKAADVVVLGLPMYNFGFPSSLQAYFDHIARAGVSFRYTAQGPIGLLGSKRVYVFATRGGRHAGTQTDGETAQVRAFLALLGFTEVEFIYAEGLNIDAGARAEGLLQAKHAIERLTARVPHQSTLDG